MKRLLIGLLLAALLTTAASADWYTDGTYHSPDYWHYAEQTRYAGDPYNTDFTDMARREESGQEYPTPDVFYITAKTVEDAEAQIEAALRYAPNTIVVTLSDRADAKNLYAKYRDWRQTKTRIDAIVGAVWTRTDNLFSVGRSGNSVIITIPRYAEGWLAYVDTSPTIRVFEDVNLSQRLLEFRRLWVDNVGGTDAEVVAQLQKLISGYAEYDVEESTRMQSNGYCVEDAVAHSIRGFVELRKAVCDGYTAAMMFALACHGIKSFDVIMQSKCGNHSVCMARIDGKWITIDLTGGSGEFSKLKWIKEIYNG